jgi:hypothetical protein
MFFKYLYLLYVFFLQYLLIFGLISEFSTFTILYWLFVISIVVTFLFSLLPWIFGRVDKNCKQLLTNTLIANCAFCDLISLGKVVYEHEDTLTIVVAIVLATIDCVGFFIFILRRCKTQDLSLSSMVVTISISLSFASLLFIGYFFGFAIILFINCLFTLVQFFFLFGILYISNAKREEIYEE